MSQLWQNEFKVIILKNKQKIQKKYENKKPYGSALSELKTVWVWEKKKKNRIRNTESQTY